MSTPQRNSNCFWETELLSSVESKAHASMNVKRKCERQAEKNCGTRTKVAKAGQTPKRVSSRRYTQSSPLHIKYESLILNINKVIGRAIPAKSDRVDKALQSL